MNLDSDLSLRLIDESERRVTVTWRLLLRCLWKWLLRQHIIDVQCVNSIEPAVATLRNLKVAECARKPLPTSRSIYREVLRNRKPLSSGPPALSNAVDEVQLSAEVPSASFVVLRSSLSLMFCLVFIRRLYHQGCVVRRAKTVSATAHWRHRVQRLALTHWKRVVREQLRWRRWLLRRCVDHWCRFTTIAKEMKEMLREFRRGLLARSYAFGRVNSMRRAHYFASWRCKAGAAISRREEERLAEYMYAAKRSIHSAVLVRDAMFGAENEPDEASLSNHLRWGKLTLKKFCFFHWKRKVEDRLEAQLGESVWRENTLKKCFEVWLVKFIAIKAARLEDSSVEHRYFSSEVVSVVECGPTYPPRALAYKQSCFERYLATKLVKRSFVFWKEKMQARHADEWYVVSLTSKALTRWVDRLVSLRAERQLRGSCFASWHRKYLRRQRSRVAVELHRALQLEKMWRRWKAAASLHSLRRFLEFQTSARLFLRWKQQARFSAASKEHQYRNVRRLFSKWKDRTAHKVSYFEADLVAEAFCQHKMMRHTFARWALAAQGMILERSSLLVFDELRGERMRRKLFERWVARTSAKGSISIH